MKKHNRKGTLLAALVFTAFTCAGAFASTISGFDQTSGRFDIDPTSINGSAGLRSYENFSLDEGDIANLIFKYNGTNIDTFVNLVDNQININGIVNSVRDGNFYSGNAVFVSPNGMVVGKTGVLNVGSLSVLTPSASAMDAFKHGKATLEQLGNQRNADVTINGKILARNDIGVVAKALSMGAESIVYSGVDGMDVVIDTADAANNLFSSLVNTQGTSKSSNIDIRTYDKFEGNGKIVNLGNGNIQIVNRKDVNVTTTPGGVVTGSTANIETKNGSIILENYAGDMSLSGNITGSKALVQDPETNQSVRTAPIKIKNGSTAGALNFNSAKITSDNGIEILDNSANSIGIDANSVLTNKSGTINLTNKHGDITILGKINSNKDGDGTDALLKIVNGRNVTDAKEASTVTLGEIESQGDIQIINNIGTGGVNVNGKITNNGNTNITNRAGMLNVKQNISNSNGTLALTGNSTGADAGVNIASGVELSNSGDIKIVNYGDKGLAIAGKITNTTGKTSATNHGGDFNFSGTINTSGDINLTNIDDHSFGAKDFNITGKITANGGTVLVQNKGTGNFNFEESASVSNAGGSTYLQNTNGLMKIAGSVDNTIESETNNGKIYIGNTGKDGLQLSGANAISNNGRIEIVNFGAGGMDVNKAVAATGNGGVHITNRNGQLVLKNAVTSEKGEITLSNIGDGGMNLAAGSEVSSEGGNIVINNAKGDATIATTISNQNGQIAISNSSSAGKLTMTGDATVTNTGEAKTYITNRATGGLEINSDVTTEGDVVVKNYAGTSNIASKVESTAGNAYLSSASTGDMTVNGTVKAKKDVIVNVSGSDVILGNAETRQTALEAGNKVSMTVTNGDIKNAGTDSTLISSGGIVYMNVYNGNIGENTNGKVDLTKSVNIDAAGRLKAFTNATKNTAEGTDLGINIATQGKDMHVDRVKADGTAMLVTAVGENGETGSILNDSSNLSSYANVKGKNIQLISSGSIGTEGKALHFRQTDDTQLSNIYANGNINIHQRGEVEEKVNFDNITSKTGNVTADMIKNGTVNNVTAPGNIKVETRKADPNFTIQSTSHDVSSVSDPFAEDAD